MRFWRRSSDGPISEARVVVELARAVSQAKDLDTGVSPPGVKQRVFRPKPNRATGRLELSTFCVDDLSRDEAVSVIESATHRRQHAHAVVKAGSLEEIGLKADADWTPERHVNVIGWSDASDSEHGSMSQAQRIVRMVRYVHTW